VTYNILVIDDDPQIIESFELIGTELEDCKFFCFTKPNQGIKIVDHTIINLLIVDIVLPNTNGYDICKEIKLKPNASRAYCILMSSDKNHLLDRIRAYKVGAQEFLHKPFDLKEAELIIRSKYEYYLQNKGEINTDVFTIGKFVVNNKYQQINIGEKSIELTPLEFNLLKFFLLNPEKRLDLNDIVRDVWGEFTESSFESARSLIYRLRTKIEPEPKNPIYITSKKNVGYIFYPSGVPII